MEKKALRRFIDGFWEQRIVPALTEFITIPNQSPAFDREWKTHGHMARAVELVREWIERQKPPGATVRVVAEGGRTPLILVEVPGDARETILFYGHIDKQPPMEGWRKGLGPWTPVRDGKGRLYGRGGADDGYAGFAAIAALRALGEGRLPHARCVVLIECSEESGSGDLPHYLNACKKQIGSPSLVICLDSGCGNYEQLWATTSLRGILEMSIRVAVLSEGVHSGIGGGVVPSPFRIARQLLERIEDRETGEIKLPELNVEPPPARVEQARRAARALGDGIVGAFPFLKGARPQADGHLELLLANAWKPALALTGQEGIPEWGQGGNVLYPSIGLKFSMRIPPGVKPREAAAAVRQVLRADPPYGAKVAVTAGGIPGWDAPEMAPWLEEAIDAASREVFGREALYLGLGGTIPFMRMIGDRFPKAQFLITGVLGPNSNAHGPNEFLHIPYAKKLTAALVRVVSAHHRQLGG
ncbi:MAG: M20/M25/M40 family metallo-hydrolase [bacterium]